MEKQIKIILAALLLLCLLNMPYGYFQFVRFSAMIGFAYLAYSARKKNEMLIYIGLAILFQPFFKIAMGRTIWNILDLIVAIGLLTSFFFKKKTINKSYK
jgi:predicted membrane protein